jgi:hypothetical protein
MEGFMSVRTPSHVCSSSAMGFGVVAYAFLYCRICVSVLPYLRFSHRRGVLWRLYRMLHGLLGGTSAHRPVSTCLSVCLSVNLSAYHFSIDPIACPSFPRLTLSLFVDSSDSELWYHFGCGAAAFASSSTSAGG